MLYLLAVILPPVAVLICGKPVQALLNLILTLIFWLPGVVHAIFIVNGSLADKRADRIIESISKSVK